MVNEWVYPVGTLTRAGWESVVDGSIEGWKHTGLRVANLDGSISFDVVAEEHIIVPLSGSFTVEYVSPGASSFQVLEGRRSPFHGPTDTLYLPTGSSFTISGMGRVAVASAPTVVAKTVAYIPRDDVPIEFRGAGNASRQVHNFGRPEALDADRFIVVEVITPGGNWSSYPRHKHDHYTPGVESNLEEIYYFEADVERGVHAPSTAEPFGFIQTTASDAGEISTLAEVHTGDVVLVPHGWHGPAVAAPGFDLYYLNVMAGPDPDRSWLIVDEPTQAWVRSAWDSQQVDPRLPYTAE
jgi:5-deoxy-glucuronate isomerase